MMLRVILLLAIVATLVNATAKKGFGLCGAAYKCGDTHALSDSSWWYNWHYSMQEYNGWHCPRYPHGEYVPMIWGERHLWDAQLPQGTKWVLGFNEPNAGNQANMSPERAAELWPQVEKLAGNRLIVGPALTSCDVNVEMCIKWYDRFFAACKRGKGCRVNKMAVHAYHCQPNQILQMLERISKQYGMNVWLTEFACETSQSTDDDIRFMKQIIPMLERAPYVERYAWFCTRLRGGDADHKFNLLDMNSSTLNKIGQAYNSIR